MFTVTKNPEPVTAVNGLHINSNYNFNNHPAIDLLIISGGQGTRILLHDETVMEWIREVHSKSELTISICSGARLLGQLGLLDHKPFCTHQAVYEHMAEIAPLAIPQKDKRFVQSDERIYTSGGISAGIDLSFHIVEALLGKMIADNTARYMEYGAAV